MNYKMIFMLALIGSILGLTHTVLAFMTTPVNYSAPSSEFIRNIIAYITFLLMFIFGMVIAIAFRPRLQW